MRSNTPTNLLVKHFPLTIDEVKEADETNALGSFLGAASVYDVIDLHGDVITRGAFDTTLKQKGPNRVLLYQHDASRPIGVGTHRDADRALMIHGQPNAEVRDAREAMALVKQQAIQGLSIGFNVVEDHWEDGVRYITEIDLWETSVVTWPANPMATITDAKSAGDTLTELRAKHTQRKILGAVNAGQALTREQLHALHEAMEILSTVLSPPDEQDDAGDTPAGSPGDATIETNGLLDGLITDIRSYRSN